MKKRLIAAVLCVHSLSAFAGDDLDPRVVEEAARRMRISIAEVRDKALHGCTSINTRDMGDCSYYWFIAEDLTMNDLFKHLMADRQGKPQQKLLLNAQRAWLVFRDASCHFEASGYLGGTGERVKAAQCMKVATEARNAQLREYASCTAAGGCP